jgi:hypothetical protein
VNDRIGVTGVLTSSSLTVSGTSTSGPFRDRLSRVSSTRPSSKLENDPSYTTESPLFSRSYSVSLSTSSRSDRGVSVGENVAESEGVERFELVDEGEDDDEDEDDPGVGSVRSEMR